TPRRRRRRRRSRRRSPSPSLSSLVVCNVEPNALLLERTSDVRPLRRPPERALGRAGRRATRPRLPRASAQPCARLLRASARRLERPRVGTARPQGPHGRRRQPRRRLGGGREACRPPARPPGSRPRGGALVKTPVVLLTGYLGSGKTTLLTRLLAHPDMGET